VLGGVIIVLVENREVDCVRSNPHFLINIPIHNFSFNPNNCRPVLKNFKPKESISQRVRFPQSNNCCSKV
jgi:hypothetical protein